MPSVSWISSYPKSGNTWTRVMIASYLLDAPVPSIQNLDEMVPDLSQLLGKGMLVPMNGSRPAIVKTHFLPSVEVLRHYRDIPSKVIYLVRNPRDILPSAARQLHIAPENKRLFAEDFIANRGISVWKPHNWGTWPEHAREWTSPERLHRHLPLAEVLTLRYEDMRKDTLGGLQEILSFLDLLDSSDPARVSRAVENSSLERMRAAEEAERENGVLAKIRKMQDNPFVGEGLSSKSLTDLGQDIEDSYRRLLKEDTEFSAMARKFGYDG